MNDVAALEFTRHHAPPLPAERRAELLAPPGFGDTYWRSPEMLTRQIGNPSLSASGIWLPGDYEITCQT